MPAAVVNVPCSIVKCRNSLRAAGDEVTSTNSLRLFKKGGFLFPKTYRGNWCSSQHSCTGHKWKVSSNFRMWNIPCLPQVASKVAKVLILIVSEIPADHPTMRWTCHWVKWPTALILHIKLSIKNAKGERIRRRGIGDISSSLWLNKKKKTGPKKRKDTRWGERERRWHSTMIHDLSHPFFPASVKMMMGGWG